MGLLDSLMGAVAGGSQGGAGGLLGGLLGGAAGNANPLVSAVLGMLTGSGQQGGGGLQELIGRFQQNGLGDQVRSWIGTGANLPVSPEQIGAVLGGDRIGAIASALGVSTQDASSQVAGVLPEIIDKLTPSGQLPAGGFGDVGSLLQALMKSR